MSAPIPSDAFAAPATALIPSRRGDGWTADAQRGFLAAIADGLKVETAARLVGLSPTSAYQLRRRAAGAAFALGWRAAALVARDRVADDLMARAIDGQFDTYERADGTQVTRHRYDNKLAMSLLARLDRQVESTPDADTTAARMVAQEFDAFLGGLTDESDAARAGLFLARRGLGAVDERDLGPVLALAAAERLACVGVATAGEVAVADLDPARRHEWNAEQWQRAEAAGLVALAAAPAETAPACEECEDSTAALADPPVWRHDVLDDWRTNFPPPAGFDGHERGEFGDDLYERTLTVEEQAVMDARDVAEQAVHLAHDRVCRDEWFGFASAAPGDAGLPDAEGPDADGLVGEGPDAEGLDGNGSGAGPATG
ncbi:MAG: hypothetical protein ABIS14_07745 [Sphingomonas sp.]